MRVREMQPDEATRVGELTVATYDTFARWPHGAPYRATLADAAARVAAGAIVLVAVDDPDDDGNEPILGSVTVTVAPNAYFEYLPGVHGDGGFRMLAVSPEAQGQGVGTALTSAAVSHLFVKGVRRAVITTMDFMEAAHALYERLGFVRRPDLDVAYDTGVGHTFHLDLRDTAVATFGEPGPAAPPTPWAERQAQLDAARSEPGAQGCD